MDLLLQAIKKGVLPEDFEEHLGKIPVEEVPALKLFYEGFEAIFYNVFSGADTRLFNSFMDILWSYSDLEEYELENIKKSSEDKSRFASILSTFKDYYFCKEGFRVLVVNSYSSISYSYFVGEPVFHVYDLEEDKELGVVMLSDETVKELSYLSREVTKWAGGNPFFATGGEETYTKTVNYKDLFK